MRRAERKAIVDEIAGRIEGALGGLKERDLYRVLGDLEAAIGSMRLDLEDAIFEGKPPPKGGKGAAG